MKKLLVISSLMLASTALCMKFDKEIGSKFEVGLDNMVSAGQSLQDKDKNGAYKIYADFRSAVNMVGLSAMLDGERYKPVIKKHKEISETLEKNEEYQKLFNAAIASTKQMNEAWQEFRKKAAHLATDILEKEIGMPFSRDYATDYKLFLERMKELNPEKDAVTIEAGVLLLFTFMQIQRNNIKELSPLLRNLD